MIILFLYNCILFQKLFSIDFPKIDYKSYKLFDNDKANYAHFLNNSNEMLPMWKMIIKKPLGTPLDSGESLLTDFDNLKTIAHMMAERARYFKSNIELDPMPAFERRIVHIFLETGKDLKTDSEGYGPTRNVVIKYTGDRNTI